MAAALGQFGRAVFESNMKTEIDWIAVGTVGCVI